MDACVESMSLRPEGATHLAAVTSKLSGNVWTGTILLIDVSDLKDKMDTGEVIALNCHVTDSRVQSFAATDSGNTDVQWINQKLMAVSNDMGQLQLWGVQDKSVLQLEGIFHEHDDIIESLSVNHLASQQILSASWDTTIKLWDLQGNNDAPADSSKTTFQGHEDAVYEVKWSPSSGTRFGSVSKDGTLRIWDSKQAKSQIIIQSSPLDNSLLSLSWSSTSENIVATGSNSGAAFIFDIRNPKTPLKAFEKISTSPIYSLEFSPASPQKQKNDQNDFGGDWLAIASDQPLVVVVNPASSNVNLKSQHHKDNVRDVCWDLSGKKLFSASWDSTILVHNLN